ncbi:unnamed protein product [Coregonus sp. 'balchen']|nr:unnamed protein product [Coregonus sp. 'balchen']
MLRFVLLSALAALVLSENLVPQPRYLEDGAEERVVGGEVAQPNSWPWQISLQYLSGSSYYHTCGGTLIRRGWVMTAAHCVDSQRTWRVVLGDHHLNSNEGKEQIKTVSQVYIHNGWNSNNVAGGYDIALLRLSTEASLNSAVQLAALPPSGQILPNNNPCYISGWGRTQNLLQLWLVGIYRQDLHGLRRRRSQLWLPDSGGPLNCQVNGQYYVHGVTSFVSSSGCNANRKPTVFTRVSAYISWMNGIMG